MSFSRNVDSNCYISKYLIFFVTLLVAVFLVFLAKYRTDGFSLIKITNNIDYDKSFEIQTITENDLKDTLEILKQNFVYLGSGHQYYVFESIDGEYVIKFLNKNFFSYPKILKQFQSFKFVNRIINRKQKRFPSTFMSMKIAFEKLKKESQLVFINLNKDIKIDTKLTLTNNYGLTFEVDLDNTFFILQKKAIPFFSHLKNTFIEEKKEGLEKSINYYLALVAYRCLKNVADDDLNIGQNIGFYEGFPVIIDTGRLYINDQLKEKYLMSEEMLKSTKRLRKWLLKYYPEEVSFLDQKIEYYLYKYCN